jgi:Calx-beta domain
VLCTSLLGAVTLAATPAAAQARIAVNDVQASENTGSMTFTITRQAGLLSGAVTVAFATVDDSARSPSDYAAVSGSRTFPATLIPQAQSQHVTVEVAEDALDEPSETLRLVVSGAGVSDGQGIGTIDDDDAAPTVEASDASPVAEGATAQFGIRLSRPSGRDVSVAFATADGSAVAGQDYAARSARITIHAGSTSVAVGVALIDDAADEPDETFELRLSAPGAATLGDSAGVATIVDGDPPTAGPSAGPPAPGPAGGSGTSYPSTGSGSRGLPQLGVSSPRLRQPSTALVTISCPRQSERCSGRLTLFSRPSKRSRIKALRSERRLGRRSFNLPGGGAQTLRIALSRRDRALLRRAGRMSVRAYVVTTDSAGRTGVRRVNGTLVARTRHSG